LPARIGGTLPNLAQLTHPVGAFDLHRTVPEVDVTRLVLLASALLLAGVEIGPAEIEPARLRSAVVPRLPVTMLGGGQVFVELTVDLDGTVVAVTPLRTTAGLTEAVTDAVRRWRFDPSQRIVENATETVRFLIRMPRVAKVFVGAVVRAPAIASPTLGSPPIDAAAADEETPFPASVSAPSYPMSAFGAGSVLVEVQIEPDGSVSDASVVESAPPFDGAALETARAFRFRPAKANGTVVRAYAYLLFGFPLPITDATGR
jgi:TonB family protein